MVREGVKGRLVGVGQGGVAGGREGEVGLVIAGRMVGTRGRVGGGRGGRRRLVGGGGGGTGVPGVHLGFVLGDGVFLM